MVPSRDGHKRVYSLDDLAEVAVICELRERGFLKIVSLAAEVV